MALTDEQKAALAAAVDADWADFRTYHPSQAADIEERIGQPYTTLVLDALAENPALEAATADETNWANVVKTIAPIVRDTILTIIPLL